MSFMDKAHLVILWTVDSGDEREWDRIFASHGEWMPQPLRQPSRWSHGRHDPWCSIPSGRSEVPHPAGHAR
jgi:hypothetical protein